ncbi:unnamed protein product [Agarophyton chilense]
MLQCPRTQTYPLHLTADTCDDVEVPFSAQFILRMLPRLNWDVFRDAAAQFPDEEMMAKLPETLPEADSLDEDALKAIHRALMEWHVVDGTLTAEGGGVYVIKDGVPNLVITEVRKDDEQGEQENEEREQEQEDDDDEAEQEAGAMDVDAAAR